MLARIVTALLCLLNFAAAAVSAEGSALAGASDKPNIIFIMADDLGYGHLGCYGQQKIQTPNIDRLAAEGMRFTDCYAGAPVCASSRSVLMTGKHGGHTSVRANSGGVRVPMIVRWPGHVPAGKVNKHIWAFDDMLPTLAELGGITNVGKVDGVSAVPSLIGPAAAGHPQQERKFFYWEIGSGRNLRQAVRMGHWKSVRSGAGKPLELFDLTTDIGETQDVAQSHPEVVAVIKAYLRTARTPPRPYAKEPPTWGYPREKTGYVR